MEKIQDLCNVTSEILANELTKLLLEKKAQNIKMHFVADKSSVTDFYVNATGRSSTHVAALADEIAELISERGRNVLRIEGKAGREWLLLDYGDVIVNIFERQAREFYDFDRLLPPEAQKNIDALIKEVDDKMKINTAKE